MEAMDRPIAPEWMEVERFFERKDRQYAKAYLEEQARYESLHEEARLGIHACKVQHAACTQTAEGVSEHLAALDSSIRAQAREYRHNRHEMETDLERISEQRLASVKAMIFEEEEAKKQATKYIDEVNNEVCHLYNDLVQAKNYRIQKSEKLQEVVSQKLDEIQTAISAEKKIRESSTHTLLELFGEMGTKMQQDIDAVKEERQLGTNRLLNLMEVVLPHLETARLNHIKAVSEKLEDQKAAAALANDATKTWQRRQTARMSIASLPAAKQGQTDRTQPRGFAKVMPAIIAGRAFRESGGALSPIRHSTPEAA